MIRMSREFMIAKRTLGNNAKIVESKKEHRRAVKGGQNGRKKRSKKIEKEGKKFTD